jgi:hypothetical protein
LHFLKCGCTALPRVRLYYVLICFGLLTGPLLSITLSSKAANKVNNSVTFKQHLSCDSSVLRWYLIIFCGWHHLLWNYHYLLVFHLDEQIWRQSWGTLHWNVMWSFCIKYLIVTLPVPVAMRSKASVCSCSPAEILSSNPTGVVSLLWHNGGACVVSWSQELCWR